MNAFVQGSLSRRAKSDSRGQLSHNVIPIQCKRPIGYFRSRYHNDGFSQRLRTGTCAEFWHSRPIIITAVRSLNTCFHKLSTKNGYGSEQTSLGISCEFPVEASNSRRDPCRYRLRPSVSVNPPTQRHAHGHGDSVVRNVIVHIVHA